MPRLSKEEWQAARERWESYDDDGFDWLVTDLKLGVSRQAVSKQAKEKGWKKKKGKLLKVADLSTQQNKSCATKNKVAQLIADKSNNIGNIWLASNEIIKSTHGGKREGAGAPPGLKATMKERAAEYGDNCIDVMVGIMQDQDIPANIRLSAAEKLLDRGYGKPKQEVEMMGEVNYVDKTLLDDRYSKNMGRTAELGLLAKERIEQLRQGALN